MSYFANVEFLDTLNDHETVRLGTFYEADVDEIDDHHDDEDGIDIGAALDSIGQQRGIDPEVADAIEHIIPGNAL